MSTNGKPKFAMYWAAACGGCEIATLNIHEKILDFDANFENYLVADENGNQKLQNYFWYQKKFQYLKPDMVLYFSP
jgi:hypothetical protein